MEFEEEIDYAHLIQDISLSVNEVMFLQGKIVSQNAFEVESRFIVLNYRYDFEKIF